MALSPLARRALNPALPAAPRGLILIGMPGAGKSTVGRWLAGHLGQPFVDTDDRIVAATGRPLQAVLAEDGPEGLRRAEEAALLAPLPPAAIVATGGSAVYSEAGMARLAALAPLVYLECDLPTLLRRLGDHGERGILMAPGQTLAELYRERDVLYRRHARLRVDARGGDPDAVGREILNRLAGTVGGGD